ncbi:hypothetical protein BJ741DRAFT_708617 [Chytriomyces cf. hyalinus JEL632]|nr:hypothetical protein BJ741DRAFT_708617 [Chytriomyces cf. hyalinus JEL632]
MPSPFSAPLLQPPVKTLSITALIGLPRAFVLTIERISIALFTECSCACFKNNEIQTGSAVPVQRTQWLFSNIHDSAATQGGVLTIVEGLVLKSIESISALQPARLIQGEALHKGVQTVIDAVQIYVESPDDHTIEINDTAGDSYIEIIHAPQKNHRFPSKKGNLWPRTPEIELNLTTGTLSGRFKAVEGLQAQVYDEIKKAVSPFASEILVKNSERKLSKPFSAKFAKVEIPYTMILDDPLGTLEPSQLNTHDASHSSSACKIATLLIQSQI